MCKSGFASSQTNVEMLHDPIDLAADLESIVVPKICWGPGNEVGISRWRVTDHAIFSSQHASQLTSATIRVSNRCVGMPVTADNVSTVRAPFETWPNSSRFRAEKSAFEAINPYASLEISRTSVSGIVIAALTSMAGPVESQPIGRSCFNASMLQCFNALSRGAARLRLRLNDQGGPSKLRSSKCHLHCTLRKSLSRSSSHVVRHAPQCRLVRMIPSDRAPTRMRLMAQIRSRLNQLRDTSLRPR